MVSIAEEKTRMMWSKILFYGCLVWLGYNCLFMDKEAYTTSNVLIAVVVSVSAASANYSKLRIEMLTLLGKTGRAE